jgi:type VI protein secretion system component VasK
MAQEVNLNTLNIDQLNLYKDKAVTMRNAGMIMTFGGVGVTAISLILVGAAFQADGGWLVTDNAAYVLIGAFYGGIITTVVGIPLWAVGGSRKTKAELTLQKFNIAPENSMVVGLGIRLRF